MRVLLPLLACLWSLGCETHAASAFYYRYMERSFNWVLADSEYRQYQSKEDDARAELQTMKMLVDVYAVAHRLNVLGFVYKAKSVEFTSYAWVTIAKRSGECDDYVELWREILREKGKTTRVCVFAQPDKVHAILLYYPTGTDRMYLLSNTEVWGQGVAGGEDRLVRSFYGDRTEDWFKY